MGVVVERTRRGWTWHFSSGTTRTVLIIIACVVGGAWLIFCLCLLYSLCKRAAEQGRANQEAREAHTHSISKQKQPHMPGRPHPPTKQSERTKQARQPLVAGEGDPKGLLKGF